jgi:hypothetical protein
VYERPVVPHVVFASSSSVYGLQARVPIAEIAVTDPISSLGIQKLAIEKYLQLHRFHRGLDVRIARLSNPFLPGQRLYGRQGFIALTIGHLINIAPLPLCEHVADGSLNMTTTQWRGALSSFGVEHGFDGEALNKVFEFRTIGVSEDEFVTKLRVPYPDYIKMDVDGIGYLILRGGREVLKWVRRVQVEINDALVTRRRSRGVCLRRPACISSLSPIRN